MAAAKKANGARTRAPKKGAASAELHSLPSDEAMFVDAVTTAAGFIDDPAARVGRDKVFISSLADELGVSLDELKARLLAAHLAHRLVLVRADAKANREAATRSGIVYGAHSVFHLLAYKPSEPAPKTVQAVRVGKRRATTLVSEAPPKVAKPARTKATAPKITAYLVTAIKKADRDGRYAGLVPLGAVRALSPLSHAEFDAEMLRGMKAYVWDLKVVNDPGVASDALFRSYIPELERRPAGDATIYYGFVVLR